jgi:hypothetical protein
MGPGPCVWEVQAPHKQRIAGLRDARNTPVLLSRQGQLPTPIGASLAKLVLCSRRGPAGRAPGFGAKQH